MPGMLLEAAKDYQLDLSSSWFIGDRAVDVHCGQNAGVSTVLVQTGYGRDVDLAGCRPDYVAVDIVGAVDFILESVKKQGLRRDD